MDDLLEVIGRNSWAAIGAGLVIGLYVIGRLDDDGDAILPNFLTIEDEERWHEARLKHLREIREAGMSKDQTLAELLALVESLKAEVEGLKNAHNG